MDSENEVELNAYDGMQAQLTWKTPAGCVRPAATPPAEPGNGGNDGKPGSDVNERVGSGVGWFFLVCVPYVFVPPSRGVDH